jgi:hypothetical protein
MHLQSEPLDDSPTSHCSLILFVQPIVLSTWPSLLYKLHTTSTQPFKLIGPYSSDISVSQDILSSLPEALTGVIKLIMAYGRVVVNFIPQ